MSCGACSETYGRVQMHATSPTHKPRSPTTHAMASALRRSRHCICSVLSFLGHALRWLSTDVGERATRHPTLRHQCLSRCGLQRTQAMDRLRRTHPRGSMPTPSEQRRGCSKHSGRGPGARVQHSCGQHCVEGAMSEQGLRGERLGPCRPKAHVTLLRACRSGVLPGRHLATETSV